MPLSEDQERIKAFVAEAITLLCKNSLKYREEFTVEGLLGITVDSEEVSLVNKNMSLRPLSLSYQKKYGPM